MIWHKDLFLYWSLTQSSSSLLGWQFINYKYLWFFICSALVWKLTNVKNKRLWKIRVTDHLVFVLFSIKLMHQTPTHGQMGRGNRMFSDVISQSSCLGFPLNHRNARNGKKVWVVPYLRYFSCWPRIWYLPWNIRKLLPWQIYMRIVERQNSAQPKQIVCS